MNTFVLVDASSYLFRAYYALPDLRSAKNFPTGAIWGVLNMLRRLRNEYATSYGVCVFDPKGGNFRHRLYPEYKANRGEMPADLALQVPLVLTITRLLGWPVLQCPDYEADDVIATLVKLATEQGYPCLISTGDKDLAQLVTPSVHLVNTMTDERLDPMGVEKKFGLAAHQIADYLALMGDRVDNIPGVPGVGPKTAVRWLSAYGSLAAVISHAEEIPGKVGERLRAHLPMLDVVRKLVSLEDSVPVPHAQIADYVLVEEDRVSLQLHFRELSFESLLKQNIPAVQEPSVPIVRCTDEALLQTWSTEVSEAALYYISAQQYALYWGGTVYGFYEPSASLEEALWARLRTVSILVHDAKRCHHITADFYGCHYEDVMLQSYILHSEEDHRLTALARRFSFALIEDGSEAFLAQACLVIYEANRVQRPLVREIGEEVYCLECRLAPILADMESRGIGLDVALLADYEQRLRAEIKLKEEAAYALAGAPINLSSPKQLQVLLFDQMGLPVIKKTATGSRSTDEDVLYALAAQSPFAALLLEHRALTKMLNTYVHKLPTCVHPETGRIHASFLQTGTVTGRLSSVNPNLQNIPVKGAHTVRDAFIAEQGFCLISADYSQIELRILAHFSGDQALCEAFASGVDIHASTAQRIFHHQEVSAVTADERRFAKTLNFGLLYGMSAFGVAKQLRIGQEEAAQFISHYFSAFPDVRTYMDTVRVFAHEKAYVETLLGRRLYLKEINHSNARLRQAAERAAINGPMQGSAADIIKLAMCQVAEILPPQASLVCQVHDELLVEVPVEQAGQVAKDIEKAMSQCVRLRVPLLVNIGIGRHWGEIH